MRTTPPYRRNNLRRIIDTGLPSFSRTVIETQRVCRAVMAEHHRWFHTPDSDGVFPWMPQHKIAMKFEVERETIGTFLTWLLWEQRFRIVMPVVPSRQNAWREIEPQTEDPTVWISRYFGIDMKRYYAEKDALLRYVRADLPRNF